MAGLPPAPVTSAVSLPLVPSCSPIGSGTGSAAAIVLLGYLCLAHRSPAAYPLGSGSAVPRTLQWTGPAHLLTGASILDCIGDGSNMRLGWHPIGMGQNPLQRWGPPLVPRAGMLKDTGPSRWEAWLPVSIPPVEHDSGHAGISVWISFGSFESDQKCSSLYLLCRA